MRIFVFIALLLVSFDASASRIDSFKASNGFTYYEGDTIMLGYGSMPNGDFKYLQVGGWGAIMAYNSNQGSDQFNVGKGYSCTNVIITKIKMERVRGAERVYFVVEGGNITNYYLWIEDAIESCEIKRCHHKNFGNEISVADELKKLSDLHKDGVLNDTEYNNQKQKLLNRQ